MSKIQVLVMGLPLYLRRARGPRTLSSGFPFPSTLILSYTHSFIKPREWLKWLTAWRWGVLFPLFKKYLSRPRNR